ncbi:MAG: extracellular solute-binding protein [Clostridia bacterium]|nr:extracellular solute-binding protein [Clostridia bacterium]
MKKLKSVFCLSLAVLMLFSMTACKDNPTTEDSGSVEIEYEYIYQSNNQDGNSDDDANSDVGGDGGSGQTGSKDNNKDDDSYLAKYKELAKKYQGTTVRYATWKDPYQNEDGDVVKAFMKEYGITVKVDMVGQSGYSRTIAGMIAANNAPDVYFCNNDFPGCLSALQPIDAGKIDKTDPIWDQGMFNASTINGKTYLVNTVGNIWNEVDCVFYNKRLLKENNITTPEDYYKAGKWNFDTMTKVMRDVKALGSDYIGGYLDWEVVLGLMNADYYKWSNGKFSNGINEDLITASEYLATCLKEGLIRNLYDYNCRDDFLKGNVGIALTNAYGLKKTGYWKKMNADDIGFTYLPDYDSKKKAVTCGLFRGWGIVKGSKNPEAAGLFLRYYLDVNNYNTSKAFISSEAESFFFKLTSGVTTDEKHMVVTVGTTGIIGDNGVLLGNVAKNDPTQVRSVILSLKNKIDSDVKTLNDFVSKQTK